MKIVFGRRSAFRLKEKLMGIFIGESTKLVFNAGTVTRAFSMNPAGKKGRSVKAGTKDVMNPFIGMKQVTRHLNSGSLDRRRNVQKRKAVGRRVSFLNLKTGNVDRADIQPGRSAGLHSGGRNTQRDQLLGKTIRSFLSNPSTFEGMLADEH